MKKKPKAKAPPLVLPKFEEPEDTVAPPSPDTVPLKHYQSLEQVMAMTKQAHTTEVRLLQAENATLRKMLAERGLALVGGSGDTVG